MLYVPVTVMNPAGTVQLTRLSGLSLMVLFHCTLISRFWGGLPMSVSQWLKGHPVCEFHL